MLLNLLHCYWSLRGHERRHIAQARGTLPYLTYFYLYTYAQDAAGCIQNRFWGEREGMGTGKGGERDACTHTVTESQMHRSIIDIHTDPVHTQTKGTRSVPRRLGGARRAAPHVPQPLVPGISGLRCYARCQAGDVSTAFGTFSPAFGADLRAGAASASSSSSFSGGCGTLFSNAQQNKQPEHMVMPATR